MKSSAASDPAILSSKRAVYVGGLADEVTPTILRAAMIPFGDIKSLDIVRFINFIYSMLFSFIDLNRIVPHSYSSSSLGCRLLF